MNRDRVHNRPKTLRGLLRWATHAYGLEPPPRLHDRDIADDGAPDHTPQAAYYLGLDRPRHLPEASPDDWRAIACRRDEDGYFRTPMRCAIEQVKDEKRRFLLRSLLTNTLFPSDVATAAGIPEWCASDVLYRSLDMLWDIYTDRPIPRQSRPKGISDAQADAEAAA